MLSVSDTASDEVVNQVKNLIQSVQAITKNAADSSLNTQAIINVLRHKNATKIPKVDYANKSVRSIQWRIHIFFLQLLLEYVHSSILL